jgi:hypothetical protein
LSHMCSFPHRLPTPPHCKGVRHRGGGLVSPYGRTGWLGSSAMVGSTGRRSRRRRVTIAKYGVDEDTSDSLDVCAVRRRSLHTSSIRGKSQAARTAVSARPTAGHSIASCNPITKQLRLSGNTVHHGIRPLGGFPTRSVGFVK